MWGHWDPTGYGGWGAVFEMLCPAGSPSLLLLFVFVCLIFLGFYLMGGAVAQWGMPLPAALAVSLSLTADGLGKTMKVTLVPGSLPPTWETQMKPWALTWPSTGCGGQRGLSQLGRSLSASPPLSHTALQINNFCKKKNYCVILRK